MAGIGRLVYVKTNVYNYTRPWSKAFTVLAGASLAVSKVCYHFLISMSQQSSCAVWNDVHSYPGLLLGQPSHNPHHNQHAHQQHLWHVTVETSLLNGLLISSPLWILSTITLHIPWRKRASLPLHKVVLLYPS